MFNVRSALSLLPGELPLFQVSLACSTRAYLASHAGACMRPLPHAFAAVCCAYPLYNRHPTSCVYFPFSSPCILSSFFVFLVGKSSFALFAFNVLEYVRNVVAISNFLFSLESVCSSFLCRPL
jgi:hypothetical protein